MKIQLIHKFEDIISLDNLLLAWQEFIAGKRQRKDVQEFSLNLMDNIITLHYDLLYHRYEHGGYQAFKISDPKPRDIHKASVRDRLLHHAVYRVLYPFFDRTFIADSYSCRLGRGTHKAINRFREFSYKASSNDTRTRYVLKGDIRKFFASIDHNILLNILKEYIPDENIIWLLDKIIGSFSSGKEGVGLPLGNLTSQLFVNIYMNKFDQFVKHELEYLTTPSHHPQPLLGQERNPLKRRGTKYIRYADDFVIFSEKKAILERCITIIRKFLKEELKLDLHPDKIFIKTLNSGVDFLGWVNFPDHRIIRTKTKRRMLKKIKSAKGGLKRGLINEARFNNSLQSYLGMLKHGRGHKIRQKLLAIN